MKKNPNRKILILFLTVVLVFLGQWYFLSNIEKEFDLLKWALGDIFLFLVLPLFVITSFFKENVTDYHLKSDRLKDNQVKMILAVEGLLLIGILYAFMLKLGWIDHFKVYLWFEGSWGVILFVELFVTPIIIFSEEFFFRGFLFKKALDNYGFFWPLIIQALAILVYGLILNSLITWQLIVLLFFINLFLGWMVIQCRNIFVSFFLMLSLRYVVDFYIIYHIKLH